MTDMRQQWSIHYSCCGEEADSVLETPASGISFLCSECSGFAFTVICQGTAEHEYTA